MWRSRVLDVTTFAYRSLMEAPDRLDAFFPGGIGRGDDYLAGKPGVGYCIGYRISDLERVFIAKPADVRFSHNGWEHGARHEIQRWLAGHGR